MRATYAIRIRHKDGSVARFYTAPPAPAMDVDAISDEALNEGWEIVMNAAGDESGSAAHDMRTALRAIFNKGG